MAGLPAPAREADREAQRGFEKLVEGGAPEGTEALLIPAGHMQAAATRHLASRIVESFCSELGLQKAIGDFIYVSTFDNRPAAPAPADAGQGGEEGLDGIGPGAGGRREVEGPARVAAEPGADFGMFVGGVVVEDWRGSACRPAPRSPLD
jgi:hypothetical protein